MIGCSYHLTGSLRPSRVICHETTEHQGAGRGKQKLHRSVLFYILREKTNALLGINKWGSGNVVADWV